ncbi:peroxin-19 [Vigna unguiculata]|uniref:Peroxin-19 n=1 Tax=Vigna unguiculata TaxID=3917 RepID=A0A4D6LG24_VIGUN|nr:peroxin-19 [Vigna unguiculata]
MEKIWHVPAYFVRMPLPSNFFRGKNAWFLHQMDISLQSDGQRAEMSVDTGKRTSLSNEIVEKYPKRLEDHKSSINKEEYERYAHQYELIQNLNEVYDNDSGNFSKIVELMHKMQEC